MIFRSILRRAANLLLVGSILSAASFGEEAPGDDAELQVYTLRLEAVDDFEDDALAKFVDGLNRDLQAKATASVAGKNRVDVEIFGECDEERLNEIRNILCLEERLEFRITADSASMDDRPIIELARKLPPDKNLVERSGQVVAEWVRYSENEFGGVDDDDGRRVVKRSVGKIPQALVLIDPWNVKGEHLRVVSKGVDERGKFAVQILLRNEGAERLKKLTGSNLPDQATGISRFLGIILNKKLISAPSIETTSSQQIQISGRGMDEKEVDEIIATLREGQLGGFLREIKNPATE